MSEICEKCGLPKQLCVCETIAKEDQEIVIKQDKKKFGKIVTIVEGMDPKEIDLKDLGKKLKSKFACGGTVKKGVIELQGDHSSGVKSELIKLGFKEETIKEKGLLGKNKK
ncbi:MAG: stress response translation initiation inhibitor YciH [Nanoarchaeota archaeon]|nr:stress response translation initiation inhibitor YciH [Nanoarchaeota archaeon]|tara:strand:- start:207 stop:539 length:333 start_codon:yes stop_codon:yes gene_type:complete